MKYDDASWHYGGDFPKDLPPENGATHIGFFLAWAFHRGFVGELHLEEDQDQLAAVLAREITGREFLLTCCDEKFTDEDLSEEGNAFAAAYYPTQYLEDFDCLVLRSGFSSDYHAPDTWEFFDRLAAILDRRFSQWKQGGKQWPALPLSLLPAYRRWWRFW
jgi:hypothetical protein